MSQLAVAPLDPQVLTPGTPEHRASEVLEQINNIREGLVDGMFDLAELLSEARENNFNKQWGYARFGDWVENGSGLDMSERTAYYLINIVNSAKSLGIKREELLKAKMSKLKEIFTLDAKTHGEEIKRLVSAAATSSLEQIRTMVQQAKVGVGIEPMVFVTFKIPQSVRDNVIRPAFELVRKQYGSVVDPATQAVRDLSEGTCFEYICVAYSQDKNNEPEPIVEPIEERE